MLQRWYDCNAGVVKVGGCDVKTYQLKKGLRRHIALVGQEPVLFDISIRCVLVSLISLSQKLYYVVFEIEWQKLEFFFLLPQLLTVVK